ncbi:hypothetical protein AZI86_12595 [Bdellovibrio bacteriovorus]|uniref:DUF366 domain-containing protein n=1 Tax=Bdellovibrio bacteriovorus TaxID=959 RepID=A0A150WIW7_BDEBC|nr:DUF366 family protein [Bdellovibrio bacteriovorus]KYG63662.1 hypothetical protein AZI86_12595 [Bdellovibrio bacteriovorus]
MLSQFIEKKMTYDGTQLRSLFAYLDHGLLGPSVVAFRGPCNISFDHMVDGEDLLAQAVIAGDDMLHFIIEVFDRDLFSGVALQRLFASICRDYLNPQALRALGEPGLVRDGDDIYYSDRKLSISIATKSPVSTMVHFAMNVTNKGTPVKTLSLEDIGVKPEIAAEDIMKLFKAEYLSIMAATQKVRPVP